MTRATAQLSLDASKFRAFLHQDIEKSYLFATAARQLRLPVTRDPLRHSLNHLQYRLASYLVEPSAPPFPGGHEVEPRFSSDVFSN